MSMDHPMGPAYVGYTPASTENQILSEVGQDDLFGAFEAKSNYIDLIRNISPMWWNMEVQPTSSYSLGMALQVHIKLGHADLFRDWQLEIRNRSH